MQVLVQQERPFQVGETFLCKLETRVLREKNLPLIHHFASTIVFDVAIWWRALCWRVLLFTICSYFRKRAESACRTLFAARDLLGQHQVFSSLTLFMTGSWSRHSCLCLAVEIYCKLLTNSRLWFSLLIVGSSNNLFQYGTAGKESYFADWNVSSSPISIAASVWTDVDWNVLATGWYCRFVLECKQNQHIMPLWYLAVSYFPRWQGA